jgi:3-phosphoshikimate 1-carboxyvinyltransferase
MSISISHSTGIIKGEITLTSSKSLSNRVLIIKGLCNDEFKIYNLSESDDTRILQQLLKSSKSELDVNLAGTAMRFLTAFFALKKGEFVLTGSERMKERPIKELVDTLIQMGANIEYLEKDGFPPLKIIGQDLKGGKFEIDGSISSQYISALLMIAVKLKKGIQIDFMGEVISKPYINMTVDVMRFYGASVHWKGNSLLVDHGDYNGKNFTVEADWSAASYWYSMVALS